MKKYIVTGGCGFIGSHLVSRLIVEGYQVVVIDDLSSGWLTYIPYTHKNVTFIKTDISNNEQLKLHYDVFRGAECVFHLAAQARIQPTLENPHLCHDVNITGMLNILEMMRALNIKNIVFSASSSSYGLVNPCPQSEGMPVDCLNPYSMSKHIGELYIKTWAKLYGLSGICLRYFNVFGPREVLVGQYAPVVGIFFRQVYQDKTPMTIVGDGEQRRDFTFVRDVVRANIMAMEAQEKDQYLGVVMNVGSGKNYSVNQVKDLVAKITDMPTSYFINTPSRPAEAKETLADISRITNALGWKPEYNLETALPELNAHYREKFGVYG